MQADNLETSKPLNTTDFTKILPIELISKIFDFLKSIEIYKLRHISSQWNSLFSQDFIYFKVLESLKFPNSVLKKLEKPAIKLYEYFATNPEYMQIPLIYACGEASSTDHHSQSIDMTRSRQDFSFWSSRGSTDRQGTQFLDYKLYGQDCLIKSISIKPFLAQFQRTLPCYAPLKVQFQIGIDTNNFSYTSPTFQMSNTPTSQIFELPVMVKGGFVRINLIGFQQTQPGDRLYYHAIEVVDIKGVWGAPMAYKDIRRALRMGNDCNEVMGGEEENDDEEWFDDFEKRSRVFFHLEASPTEGSTLYREMSAQIFNESRVQKTFEKLILQAGAKQLIVAHEWLAKNQRKRDLFNLLKDGDLVLAQEYYGDLSEDWRDQELLDVIIKICPKYSYFFTSCWDTFSKDSMILSEPETLLLIRISIETHSFTLLESILQAELFVPSLGVGLEFEKTRGLEQLALHVYHVGRIVDKIITLSISIDRFRDAAHGILVAYPRDEINGVLCDLHAKFGRISIAKVLVNLVILMEYDGMTVDSQGFYNQVGTLMALGAVESRSDFLMKLGEIADS